MEEIKTDDIPTTIEEPDISQDKVRFLDVVKKVIKSNADKKKNDRENDVKVVEAKEKVKIKRKEIKDELQKNI